MKHGDRELKSNKIIPTFSEQQCQQRLELMINVHLQRHFPSNPTTLTILSRPTPNLLQIDQCRLLTLRQMGGMLPPLALG